MRDLSQMTAKWQEFTNQVKTQLEEYAGQVEDIKDLKEEWEYDNCTFSLMGGNHSVNDANIFLYMMYVKHNGHSEGLYIEGQTMEQLINQVDDTTKALIEDREQLNGRFFALDTGLGPYVDESIRFATSGEYALYVYHEGVFDGSGIVYGFVERQGPSPELVDIAYTADGDVYFFNDVSDLEFNTYFKAEAHQVFSYYEEKSAQWREILETVREDSVDFEVDLEGERAWWVEGDMAWKITKNPQGLTLAAWHEESDQPIERSVESVEALPEAKAELFDLVTKTNLDLSDLDQLQGLEQ